MLNISFLSIILVALLHLGFFFLESILWTSPKVVRLFEHTQEDALSTRVLALNQGFYNLGVSALLIGFTVLGNTEAVEGVLIFIVAMGVVGAVTANWRILLMQSAPALVALMLV